MAAHRTIAEYISQFSSTQAKLKVVEIFLLLQERADKADGAPSASYARRFNRCVRQHPVICKANLYFNKPPAFKDTEAGTLTKDPSKTQQPWKDDHGTVIKVRGHTLSVDISGIHNMVANYSLSVGTDKWERISR